MGRPAKHPRGQFGERLAALREEAGLTQAQLAEKIGVRQSSVAFWERWDKPPRGEILPKLTEVLSVRLDDLLGTAKNKAKPAVAKGRLQAAFQIAAKLPKRQQHKIAEVVEALAKAS